MLKYCDEVEKSSVKTVVKIVKCCHVRLIAPCMLVDLNNSRCNLATHKCHDVGDLWCDTRVGGLQKHCNYGDILCLVGSHPRTALSSTQIAGPRCE